MCMPYIYFYIIMKVLLYKKRLQKRQKKPQFHMKFPKRKPYNDEILYAACVRACRYFNINASRFNVSARANFPRICIIIPYVYFIPTRKFFFRRCTQCRKRVFNSTLFLYLSFCVLLDNVCVAFVVHIKSNMKIRMCCCFSVYYFPVVLRTIIRLQ